MFEVAFSVGTKVDPAVDEAALSSTVRTLELAQFGHSWAVHALNECTFM